MINTLCFDRLRYGAAQLALLFLCAFFLFVPQAQAAAGFGLHVLRPEEFTQVVTLFSEYRTEDKPVYVTVPFTLQDTEPKRLQAWKDAFGVAKEHNIIPLVRFTTRFNSEKNAWEIPGKKDIITLTKAVNQLPWPQEKRHVILFNEPNHNAEWGGAANPEEFAEITEFAARWLQTESAEYVVLPAAVDLAAPNGKTTQEGLQFWQKAITHRPEMLELFDAWNSHSYPNPGFTGTPQATGKNSLRGFEHELALLSQHSSKEWPVFITETGWRKTPAIAQKLDQYYVTAWKNVWNKSQIVAVTPFVLAGSPGPFAEFSFVDESAKPTGQWQAMASMLKKVQQTLLSDRSVLQ